MEARSAPDLPSAAERLLEVAADEDRELVGFIDGLRGRLPNKGVRELLDDVYAGSAVMAGECWPGG